MKIFVAMDMPNLNFTKGIIIDKATSLEEKLDSEKFKQKGWQKIEGTTVTTHIEAKYDFDSSDEKDEEGKPLGKKKDRIVATETRIIDSVVTYPENTKLIWREDVGYVKSMADVTEPKEIIKRLEVIEDKFKDINKEGE